MPHGDTFNEAFRALDDGDVAALQTLLAGHPELATETDEGNATLLIRLIDYPGHRPNSVESAQALIAAGASVDARRNDENGTPLSGAVCVNDMELICVLLEAGANIHAACGWRQGTVLDQVDELCGGLHSTEYTDALKEVFSRVAGRCVPRQVEVGRPIPLLFVSDFEASLKYYTENVGFRLAWRHDENPGDPYASIVRGDTDFHITVCTCDGDVHVGRLKVRIETREIDRLYEELNAASVMIRFRPQDQPWGLREFEITDPDSNRLTFFQH